MLPSALRISVISRSASVSLIKRFAGIFFAYSQHLLDMGKYGGFADFDVLLRLAIINISTTLCSTNHWNSNHCSLLSFKGIVKNRTIVGRSHAVAFILPRHTTFKHICKHNSQIFRLCDVGDIRPLTAFSVLCRKQRRVYHNRLNTKIFADLILDILMNGVVIFIKKISAFRFF